MGRCHHDPIPPFAGKRWVYEIEQAVRQFKIVEQIESDRFTDPIPTKPGLRLRHLLHPRISAGGILRNQADWGIDGPFVVLVMARVR